MIKKYAHKSSDKRVLGILADIALLELLKLHKTERTRDKNENKERFYPNTK